MMRPKRCVKHTHSTHDSVGKGGVEARQQVTYLQGTGREPDHINRDVGPCKKLCQNRSCYDSREGCADGHQNGKWHISLGNQRDLENC